MRATQNIPGYRKARGDETRCKTCKHGLPEIKGDSDRFRLYCSFHDGHMSVAATHTCDYINARVKTGKKNGKENREKS